MSNEIHLYQVTYVSSSGQWMETSVYARNEQAARNLVKVRGVEVKKVERLHEMAKKEETHEHPQ